MLSCAYCRAQLPQQANFCSQCGKPVRSGCAASGINITRARRSPREYAFITNRALEENDEAFEEIEDLSFYGDADVEQWTIEDKSTLVVKFSSARICKKNLETIEEFLRSCYEDL